MTTTLSAAPTTDALMGVYRKPPMELVRGAGVELFDADGKGYLDFVARSEEHTSETPVT